MFDALTWFLNTFILIRVDDVNFFALYLFELELSSVTLIELLLFNFFVWFLLALVFKFIYRTFKFFWGVIF